MVAYIEEKNDYREKPRAPVKRWSEEEDLTLRQGVLTYLSRNIQPDYNEICQNLPGRSVKQAKERWRNSLNPSITKGLWSKDEVIQLLDLIVEKGENWTEIQEVLSHRSMHCIKSKGRKLLGEAISKKLKKACGGKLTKVWTKVERRHLLELHKLHGYDMETICFALKSGKSMADAHRELILRCNCTPCTMTRRQLEASKLDFKLAWAVNRANELKTQILNGELKPKRSRKQVDEPSVQNTKKRSFSLMLEPVLEEITEATDITSELGNFEYEILFGEARTGQLCRGRYSDDHAVDEVQGNRVENRDISVPEAACKRQKSHEVVKTEILDIDLPFPSGEDEDIVFELLNKTTKQASVKRRKSLIDTIECIHWNCKNKCIEVL